VLKPYSTHLSEQETYLRSWALLEKLPIVQPLKNFPAFYGTRRFITLFTRDLHWSLSWTRRTQSTPSHPISLSYILILSTHLRLGLPSGLFPSGFPINNLRAFLFSSIRDACPVHLIILDLINLIISTFYRVLKMVYNIQNYVWRGVQVMKLLIMQFPQISRHFISLRSKYSPQHPVLKHPQSMFLP
jgi:hypothetical protein